MIYSVLCNYLAQPVPTPLFPKRYQGAGRPSPWLILLQTQASLMESLGVMLGRFMLPVCSLGCAGAECCSVAVPQLECCSCLKCRLEFDWEPGYCCRQCRQTGAIYHSVQRRSCGVMENFVCCFCFLG